ncbi:MULTISPECIES: hypothetical protein [unclassified Bradyrhizobium]|uniref:hypothetical protein n=1 Tax=unclassified Bradyrhizobium TaxID=2631580 RepID=UPI00211E0277|nr:MULTISPECIES: hypothetical protein [unclassified Bradyrhizobium]MDD1532687.1 hypothetical protein [Bradyrhizobium sp. WBOS8]MDD1581599.1 hypothetical protein [Bradyrhizobium sp. WBOS4]UUO49871.1 hypothetical protein DCM78_24965 [Bradyrhizobium sp. WBOS04]UUO58638.1 hypothetical protein DCM80_05245 [Bradyrhizobium sp. WBOS08]
MRRRIALIPQRRPIFLGCEGQSEEGYGALLGRLARELDNVHIHLHAEVLQPGAGDPEALVVRAVQRIDHIQRRRAPFAVKAVMLDRGTAQKNAAAEALARANGIDYLIWQNPDFEAVLLRHLPGCQALRPPAGRSMQELQRRWPGYQKGTPALQLARQITLAEVRLAATVEPDLSSFLQSIGLL